MSKFCQQPCYTQNGTKCSHCKRTYKIHMEKTKELLTHQLQDVVLCPLAPQLYVHACACAGFSEFTALSGYTHNTAVSTAVSHSIHGPISQHEHWLDIHIADGS